MRARRWSKDLLAGSCVMPCEQGIQRLAVGLQAQEMFFFKSLVARLRQGEALLLGLCHIAALSGVASVLVDVGYDRTERGACGQGEQDSCKARKLAAGEHEEDDPQRMKTDALAYPARCEKVAF